MTTSTSKFYNSIFFLYPVINNFLEKHRKVLIREVNALPPGKLLEVGVGTGSHLPQYAWHHITGIDISEAMLKKAMRYQGDKVELLLMDGEELLFPEASFDYVVMSHVIAVTNNPDKVLEQVHRVLKPGGKLLVLNHFTPDNWLKYMDKAFKPLSPLFHFKSVFYLQNISGFRNFRLLKRQNVGRFSYFKLLILFRP